MAAILSVGEFDRFMSSESPAKAFANPKSNTFTLPSEVILMLAGSGILLTVII